MASNMTATGAAAAASLAEGVEEAKEKIQLLSASEDGSEATFVLNNEDHTLSNVLRSMLMRNPDVSFCGYSIPHPSEEKVHLRVQTNKKSATKALEKALDDLTSVCEHILHTVTTTLEQQQPSSPMVL